MYFYMTAGLILFRCIEIGFYKTLSSLYQLTNNNKNNNNNNDATNLRSDKVLNEPTLFSPS